MPKENGWTMRENNRALREGWAIFESNEGLRLERDDEDPKFGGDGAAWRHVRKHARKGSTLHRRALAHLKQEAPAEYRRVMAG